MNSSTIAKSSTPSLQLRDYYTPYETTTSPIARTCTYKRGHHLRCITKTTIFATTQQTSVTGLPKNPTSINGITPAELPQPCIFTVTRGGRGSRISSEEVVAAARQLKSTRQRSASACRQSQHRQHPPPASGTRRTILVCHLNNHSSKTKRCSII